MNLDAKKDCPQCRGTGSVSYPITHPSNPNLDSWGSQPCDCLYTRIVEQHCTTACHVYKDLLSRVEAVEGNYNRHVVEHSLERTRPGTAEYRAGYDAGFKAGLIAAKELYGTV